MKQITLIILLGILGFTAQAQEKKQKKTETATIQTSAECDMCKETIESSISFEKGIKLAEVNAETGVLKIEYNPAKTTIDAIRQSVSKLGYDADSIPADAAAYDKLPSCCKKGGMHK